MCNYLGFYRVTKFPYSSIFMKTGDMAKQLSGGFCHPTLASRDLESPPHEANWMGREKGRGCVPQVKSTLLSGVSQLWEISNNKPLLCMLMAPSSTDNKGHLDKFRHILPLPFRSWSPRTLTTIHIAAFRAVGTLNTSLERAGVGASVLYPDVCFSA